MKPLDQFNSTDIRQHGEALRSATAPELDSFDSLAQRARQHRMTADEVRAQRISFAHGQLMDCAPQVTRDQVAALHDEVYGMGEPPRPPVAPPAPPRTEPGGPGLWPFLAPLAMLAAAAALVWAASTLPAPAQQMHDMTDPAHWYDLSCCSGHDCAPVTPAAVTETLEGYRVTLHPGDHPLVSRPISEVVPAGDKRLRPSQDRDWHVCISAATQRVLCVYRPEDTLG